MVSYNEILVLTRINKLAEEDVSKSISGFKLINEGFKFINETNINERVILYNTLKSLVEKGLLKQICSIREILSLHGGSSAVSITKDGVTLAKKYS
jgi:hypothetical protein